MLITVLKTYEGQIAVHAEQRVNNLEELVMFATTLGVNQAMQDYLQDFEQGGDRTYIVGLENELT